MLIEEMYLFEPDPPYQRHSPTSRAAAEAIKPKMREQHRRVLAALRRCGPMTDQEIARATGMSENSARPRRIELCRDHGLVVAAGESKTSSGRRAQLWRLV